MVCVCKCVCMCVGVISMCVCGLCVVYVCVHIMMYHSMIHSCFEPTLIVCAPYCSASCQWRPPIKTYSYSKEACNKRVIIIPNLEPVKSSIFRAYIYIVLHGKIAAFPYTCCMQYCYWYINCTYYKCFMCIL